MFSVVYNGNLDNFKRPKNFNTKTYNRNFEIEFRADKKQKEKDQHDKETSGCISKYISNIIFPGEDEVLHDKSKSFLS